MIYNKSLSGFELDSHEICINLWYVSESPSSMQVNIPKLMPLISKGRPDKSFNKMTVNGGIFANASDCKVSVPSLVTTQNFLTIEPHPNRSVSFPNKSKCEHENLVPGQKFLCEIVQGDIRNIYLTDKM